MVNSSSHSADRHMKILGEELGDIGRWYIALPPLLLIGFLIGLFFLAVALVFVYRSFYSMRIKAGAE